MENMDKHIKIQHFKNLYTMLDYNFAFCWFVISVNYSDSAVKILFFTFLVLTYKKTIGTR